MRLSEDRPLITLPAEDEHIISALLQLKIRPTAAAATGVSAVLERLVVCVCYSGETEDVLT